MTRLSVATSTTTIPVLIFLLLGSAAHADVLVLKNGDKITGEITKIWDDEITIEPEYADEFDVDLSAVKHIEADRSFEIELADGRSVLARLGGLDSEGNQVVQTEDEMILVPLLELTELEEPAAAFEWESNVDLSAALNKGNTDSSAAKVRGDISFKFPDHRHLGTLTINREEVDNVPSQEQDLFVYDYNWLFRDPWFLSARLSLEQDPIRELDSRIIASAGIGLDIWDKARRALNIQLGAGYQTEESGMSSDQSAVAVWGLRYRQDFIGDDLELFHNHTVTSNISGRRNVVTKTSTGISYEITDLLYTSLSLDYDHESQPAEAAQAEDIALLLGFGLEF